MWDCGEWELWVTLKASQLASCTIQYINHTFSTQILEKLKSILYVLARVSLTPYYTHHPTASPHSRKATRLSVSQSRAALRHTTQLTAHSSLRSQVSVSQKPPTTNHLPRLSLTHSVTVTVRTLTSPLTHSLSHYLTHLLSLTVTHSSHTSIHPTKYSTTPDEAKVVFTRIRHILHVSKLFLHSLMLTSCIGHTTAGIPAFIIL